VDDENVTNAKGVYANLGFYAGKAVRWFARKA
jgi:hypothetical protein